ncbi:Glucose-6-phosphate isomerase [Planctomycetes bacterium CA13]|uniref:Glucose-6-phosphate isomerase n=1 Tax=Novipirellula herctigrandis TaxID=2527986 RepID=A0A5C5Z7L9_9BACT|nr:Glucose-6-phosphate isomerase [Planctomycetes bacterium CA13]
MSFLDLDISNSLECEYGVEPQMLESVRGSAESIRDAIAVANPFPCDGKVENESNQGQYEDLRFFRLPETELADYVARREGSLLGRIFKIANTIHEKIDAVVVLGCNRVVDGPHGIMQASCEPFHNELSRAERGSRPRMYFGGGDFDNDVNAALQRRLVFGGYVDTPPEERWAVVMIGNNHDTMGHSKIAFHQTLGTLEKSLAGGATLADYVIPIAKKGDPLGDLARSLGCEDVYEILDGLTDGFAVLSSVSLMPAALLGLDCMRLLEGAAAMNEHFLSAPFAENHVLRYAAIHHLLAQHRGMRHRATNTWSHALGAIGTWYQNLVESHLSPVMEMTPLAWTHRCDVPPNRSVALVQWVVDTPRMDPVPTVFDGKTPTVFDGKTLPNLTNESIETAIEAARFAKCPSMTLSLPHLDSHTIGQLLQMLMLSTVIEARLHAEST